VTLVALSVTRVGIFVLKKLFLKMTIKKTVPKNLGKKMLYGYGHLELNRAKTIEEL
jgi:hypothetical protein